MPTLKQSPPRHARRVLAHALLAGLPAVLATAALLWLGEYSTSARWTLLGLVVGAWLGFSFHARERIVFTLRTVSNLLAAQREGDFSLRARAARDDAMGEVMAEVNLMSAMLREQRLSALEATQLLRKVMEEIDVAVFAFDARDRLKLVNRAGERLLGRPAERLLDLSAAELGLAEFLDEATPDPIEREFPGAIGRWRVRRGGFRERGEPHRLLVLSDVTRELRAEELAAWRRLARVLGHEINNSLAPVKSLAGSMGALLERPNRPADWEADLKEALAVIESRVDALRRFAGAYAGLAKLPEPRLEPTPIDALIRRVAKLETRLAVAVREGPSVVALADPAQIEQALINLVRNAAEASLETGGAVEIGWTASASGLDIRVSDQGPGLADDANLFVPFYTTKRGGSGIGLVLARRIAESHGGSATIENHRDGPGCVARLRLPLDASRLENGTTKSHDRHAASHVSE